jgi:hypothetical protein
MIHLVSTFYQNRTYERFRCLGAAGSLGRPSNLLVADGEAQAATAEEEGLSPSPQDS